MAKDNNELKELLNKLGEEEWVVSVLLSKFVMNAFYWKEFGVKKNESQTIYR